MTTPSFLRALSLLAASSLAACDEAPPPAPCPACPTCPAPPPITNEQAIKRFHEVWYASQDTWLTSNWLGVKTRQNPMDVWIIQEILFQVKPDFMIECGSQYGGSAALWATMLEQINPAARVISIDITDQMQDARKLPIVKRKVDFLVGSSTDPKLVEGIARRVKGKKVLVLLDSDYRKPHVLEELKRYSPLVGVGGYIIVEDTNVNGHPILPNFQGGVGGPWEAVEEFLKGNDAFQIDRSRERMLFTFAPNGFLKRVK